MDTNNKTGEECHSGISNECSDCRAILLPEKRRPRGAGKQIDKAVEKAGQQIEKAGEKIEDAAKGANKK